MPKLVGGLKLPSTTLLHRPDEHSAINELELKNLAQVLGGEVRRVRCARGRWCRSIPARWLLIFEFKPEAGIKYSRITGLCDDLCLALSAPRAS